MLCFDVSFFNHAPIVGKLSFDLLCTPCPPQLGSYPHRMAYKANAYGQGGWLELGVNGTEKVLYGADNLAS